MTTGEMILWDVVAFIHEMLRPGKMRLLHTIDAENVTVNLREMLTSRIFSGIDKGVRVSNPANPALAPSQSGLAHP